MDADLAWGATSTAVTMDMDEREESPSQVQVHGAEDQDNESEHARPRKRTRRACDKCSTSRTRCDGENPWYVLRHYAVLDGDGS